jgi:AP-3 complex subunit delta-1
LPAVIFSYDLNPVNERAQSLVEVPESLDLDRWIVGGSIVPLPAYRDADEVDEFGRPRGGFALANGSGAHVQGPRKAKKSKKGDGELDGKKKKKVRFCEPYRPMQAQDYFQKKPKEHPDSEDIDSIPIVKLDLNARLKPDQPKRVERARSPTPPPVFVDVEGELPPARASTPRQPAPVQAAEVDEKAAVESPAPIAPTAVQVVKKKKSKRPKTGTVAE